MSRYFFRDLSRCHDSECAQAGRCLRYLTRKTKGWVSHALSFRDVGTDGSGCPGYVPECLGVKGGPGTDADGRAKTSTLDPEVRGRILAARWSEQ